MKTNQFILTGPISRLLNADHGGGSGTGDATQQQEPPVADPFEGIDQDLLTDEARAAITNAKKQMTTLAAQAKQASVFQGEKDRLAHVLAQQQQILHSMQSQQQGNQQQQAPPPTIAEELEAEYLNNNIPAHVAKPMAIANAKLMARVQNDTRAQVLQEFQPFVQQTGVHTAQAAFGAVAHLPFAQDADTVAKLNETVGQMLQDGQNITPELLTNLGRMYHYDKLHSMQNQQQQPPVTPPVTPPPPMTKPQLFSFSQPPVGGVLPLQQKPQANSEVSAAMAGIKARWTQLFKPTAKGGSR